MNELVSVILTTYNRYDSLKKVISSVLNQEYSSIELIVVDDCSTDNTFTYMNKIGDNRVIYIRNETNLGNAKSRNIGSKKAKGYYIAFMDDDDLWIDEKKISLQIECIKKGFGDLICSNVIMNKKNHSFKKVIKFPKNLSKHILVKNGIIFNSSVFLTYENFIKVGFFDENLPRGVDSDFFRRAIIRNKLKIHKIDKFLISYGARNDNRITDNITSKGIENDIESNLICLTKFEKEFNIYKFQKYQRIIKAALKNIIYFLKKRKPIKTFNYFKRLMNIIL